MLNNIEPYMRFTGQATRREYWSVMVYTTIALLLWFMLVTLFALPMVLLFIVIIPVLITQWATIIRRQADIGVAWWWLLLIFLPYVGMIWWLLLGILPKGMFDRG